MVPFHYVKYGFLLLVSCSTLSVRCTVFEIFDFNNAVTLKIGLGFFKVIGNRDLEIPVRGQSRSLKVVQFDRAHMTSY